MTTSSNMRGVWSLVARSRPHLTASQLRYLGTTFQLHRREILALTAAGIGAQPDAELAQQLLGIARRMRREGAKSS